MSLNQLPDIQFVDTAADPIVTSIISGYEAISGRTLYPADPVRLFLLSIAQIIIQQRVVINQTAKSELLRYAAGPVLDHLGSFAGASRLPAVAASTTIRFTLSAPQTFAVAIPAGTRVSTSTTPQRNFATIAYGEVAPGALTVDLAAQCTEAGEQGNGLLPGQIKNLVDPIAYISSSANLTESAGGDDVETDDAYRERIRTVPESYSVAGPEGAYRFWAKTASSRIVDVSVSSPSPGQVLIVPLLVGGEIPGTEILDAVNDICNSKTVRPLTDQVIVQAPEEVSYDINLTYWINQDQAARATAIQAAVLAALEAYVLWQKSKLGRPINPSELIRRVMAAGAYRVNVSSPVYAAVGVTGVAIADEVTVNYGGLTDD